MTLWALLFVGLAALVGAIISALTGVAGGVILLSALVLAAPAQAVVPLHGSVQLIANTARIGTFRQHIVWPTVVSFVATVIPGSLLAVPLLRVLSPELLRGFIALAILLTLSSRKTSKESGNVVTRRSPLFLGVGLVCGFLGMLVGSTGPLLTQALLYAGVEKERHIATKAVCQAFANAVKLGLFGATMSFDFDHYTTEVLVLGTAVGVGTFLGKKLLAGIRSQTFLRMTRMLLGAIAIKILVVDVGFELWG